MKVIVHAKPNARVNTLESLPSPSDRPEEIHIAVSVTEPPIQGRANRAIIEVVAEHYQVPVSSLRLVSGFSSRIKVLEW